MNRSKTERKGFIVLFIREQDALRAGEMPEPHYLKDNGEGGEDMRMLCALALIVFTVMWLFVFIGTILKIAGVI